MIRLRLSSILLLCVAGFLHAQVDTPGVGLARYSDGSVRPIYGFHANFVIGKQAIGSADAISCSDSATLIAERGAVKLFGRGLSLISEYDSGESSPLLNVDGDPSSAVAWLPVHHALLHWTGRSFVLTEIVPGDLPGRVTSVRVESPNSAAMLVTGADGSVFEARVLFETGDLLSLNVLPGVTGPAFFQNSFVVFHDRYGLEIASRDGALRTLPVKPGDLQFDRMSSDWVHISSLGTHQNWILHLNSTKLELSELPAAPQGAQK